VSKFPAGAGNPVAPLARQPLAGPDNAPQLFGIEMHQFAGDRALVPPRRRRQLQHVQPRPATAADDPSHGRPADADRRRDLATRPALPPQHFDPQDDGRRCGVRAAMRPRAAVGERLPRPRPAHPLPDRLLRDPRLPSYSARRPPHLENLAYNFCSTLRRQPGILVDVHPGILLIDLACLATTTFDETPRMDNPLQTTS
jgi:hypothetical protein